MVKSLSLRDRTGYMKERTRPQPHKVSAPSFTFAPTRLLQRECACGNHTTSGSECAEFSKSRLWIQGATRNPEPQTRNWDGVPLIVNEVLHSPGQPLDAATRAFFEPRFGHAFSQVRVHTDAKAAESARAVNALAYTVGRHVVFCSGQYAPSTRAGKNLLAVRAGPHHPASTGHRLSK